MSRNVRISIGLVAAVVATVAVAALLTRDDDDGATVAADAPQDRQELLVRADSPRLTDGDQAEFVEFLDFECEACAALHPTIQELKTTYGDRVAFVVRYMPLHVSSMNAALAAEAAGAKAPSGLDGVSVLPTLLGKQQKPHESLYWELPRYDAATKSFRKEKPMAAMRRGTMKILRPKPDAAVELYDLAADRTEKNDLAAKMPDVTQRMEQQLAASRTEPRQQDEPLHPWWDARS